MIKVSNKRPLITKRLDQAYQVVKGTAMVFVLVSLDGQERLHSLLYEAHDGEKIPACNFYRELDQKEFLFEFMLASNDEAELEEISADENIVNDFCTRTFGEDIETKDLEEHVYQFILDIYLAHKSDIVHAKEATDLAANQTIERFKAIFKKTDHKTAMRTELSGNALYDSTARVCDWMQIDHIPYSVVSNGNKKKFSLEDIARLSGFVTREVILETDWHKKDLGPLLVYRGSKREPAALIPKENEKGYYLWKPETAKEEKLTAKDLETINIKAMMLYKSFPNKAMNSKDLLKYAIGFMNRKDVLAVFLLMLLETLIGLLLPIINEKIYDFFIPLGDSSGLMGMCSVITACTLGTVAFGIVKGFANNKCFNRIKYNVQAATFDRLYSMPVSFFREYQSAELAQNAFGVGSIVSLLQNHVFLTGFSTLFSIFYFFRMKSYSSSMTKISVIILFVSMGIILLLGKKNIKLENEKKITYNDQSSILYQLITSVDKLRIAGAEQRGLAQYFKVYEKTALLERSIGWIGTWNGIINASLSTVSSIVFYYLMIRKNMGLSMGSFLGFISTFGAFSGAMLQLVSSILEMSSVVPDYKELKPLFETPPEIDTNAEIPGEITGEIDISNVSFGYSEDHFILNDFSLSIKSGEYIGIVGSSGCGKSTLLKILMGFETPQLGKVFYDSMDIESINKRELRKQFGVVLQNGDTISGSIYDNITITDPTVGLADVQQAIKDCGLEADIARMPMGLHTILSEGGGGVSGGQKQRILIARAIVSKPKVLFFDEATSALDNRTQQQVCETVEKLNCTKIVIAHRLSTIMNCDRIIVMDAGRIVEQGTYEELLQNHGLFYQLAKRQMM